MLLYTGNWQTQCNYIALIWHTTKCVNNIAVYGVIFMSANFCEYVSLVRKKFQDFSQAIIEGIGHHIHLRSANFRKTIPTYKIRKN